MHVDGFQNPGIRLQAFLKKTLQFNLKKGSRLYLPHEKLPTHSEFNQFVFVITIGQSDHSL